MEGIVTWIMERVALELSIMATAAAASAGLSEVLDAVRRIYRAIKTAVRWARTIVDMVNRTLDAVLDIAAGALDGPAEILHGAMKKATPAVIGFLGDQVGLGGIADEIKSLVTKLRKKVDDAILAIIDAAKALFASLVAGAKAVAGKVLDWWKSRTRIDADGKSLTLITDGSEEEVRITIEASPPKTWMDYVATLPDKVKTTPEYAQALALARKIEARRPAIREPDKTKKAQLKDQAAKVMMDDINALVPLIKLLNGNSAIPTSLVEYGGTDSFGGALSAEATILSGKHPPGTEPGDYAQIWNDLAGLGAGLKQAVRKDWYVQGHLLNHNIGGPGMRFNLTPIAKQTNKDHLSKIETPVKTEIAKGTVLYYSVQPLPAWGSSLRIPRLTQLEQDAAKGTKDDPRDLEIESLKALSRLTQGFVCRAYELEKNAEGKWVQKKGGSPFDIPKQTIPNTLLQSGGLPYGYH
jgi:hypothetical protein